MAFTDQVVFVFSAIHTQIRRVVANPDVFCRAVIVSIQGTLDLHTSLFHRATAAYLHAVLVQNRQAPIPFDRSAFDGVSPALNAPKRQS